jgi:two-component system, chemotaxis family, chemotaxis protein CheY
MAKRVLAVDDSLTIRQLIKMTLSRAGYEIVEAEDGAKGLQKASAETFDLVLSDINMPIMTGIEMLRSLRKLAQYKFTPIVLVTTESQPGKKQEGKAAGATGWIVKPFEPEQLLAVVTKVLRC